MKSRRHLLFILLVAILAAVICCQGCTVRFKATDVELDSVASAKYELESVSVFDGKDN